MINYHLLHNKKGKVKLADNGINKVIKYYNFFPESPLPSLKRNRYIR